MIISAYTGMGKTYFAENYKGSLKIEDLDSSNFSWVEDITYLPNGDEVKAKQRNPRFVDEYVEAILKSDADIVLISTHSEVRKELTKRERSFYTVYPTEGSKEKILDRLIKRGDDDKFVEMIGVNFENDLDSIEKSDSPGGYLNAQLNLSSSVSSIYSLLYDLSPVQKLLADFGELSDTEIIECSIADLDRKSNFFSYGPMAEEYVDGLKEIQDKIEDTGRWHIYGTKIFEHPTDKTRFLAEDYTHGATESQENEASGWREVKKHIEMKEVVSYR